MESPKITVSEVGDTALIFLGDVVEELRIRPDELYDHIELILCLREDTWANREEVISKMVDFRALYFDEYSIEYSFGDHSTGSAFVDGPYVSQRELVFAR